MPKDASLDQFLGDDGASDDETTEGSAPPDDPAHEPADQTSTGEPADTDATAAGADEPAVTTYRFDPDGAACADCGETVTARWRDAESFVCSACKSW